MITDFLVEITRSVIFIIRYNKMPKSLVNPRVFLSNFSYYVISTFDTILILVLVFLDVPLAAIVGVTVVSSYCVEKIADYFL
jgi:hypothetical protein